MSKRIVSRPRLMIAAAASGSGKTTLTCALLRALSRRGLQPAAFKCGPDYIDPLFHEKALGVKSRNLDLYMCGETAIKHLFAENSRGADLSVLEGVMGLYDGLAMGGDCSSNHLSLVTGTPVVLAVDAKGMGLSLAAQVAGFLRFRPNNIKGVLLNRVSAAMYPMYKAMLEKELAVKVYGYLPPVEDASFASRHLGLVTAEEVADIQRRLDALADACARTVDLDGLLALGKEHAAFEYDEIELPRPVGPVSIGVARDKAFCFYYEDNLALLEKLGASLVYFSPLADSSLPEGIDGLILGGGYPEEHAGVLSGNASMLDSVRQAVVGGLPTIAECGGFMYLCRSLADRAGQCYRMTGVIDADCTMGDRLANFGYIGLTARMDNLLCAAGSSINGHEFHYSASSDAGACFTARKASGKEWPAIHATATMLAGYPHLHFWGNREFARAFVEKCRERMSGG